MRLNVSIHGINAKQKADHIDRLCEYRIISIKWHTLLIVFRNITLFNILSS